MEIGITTEKEDEDDGGWTKETGIKWLCKAAIFLKSLD